MATGNATKVAGVMKSDEESGYLPGSGRKQVEQALRDSQADLSHAQFVARIGNWRLNKWTAR